MQTLGFVKLLETDAQAGRVVVQYTARPEQCHSGNIVQSGFVTAWIDNAMATAVMLKTQMELTPLSLDIQIAFYDAAHPGPVFAEGWIERMGRKTAFVEGVLRTEDGRVVAKGMSTVKLVAPRR